MVKITKIFMALLMVPIFIFSGQDSDESLEPPERVKCFVISQEYVPELKTYKILYRVAVYYHGEWFDVNSYAILPFVLDWENLEISQHLFDDDFYVQVEEEYDGMYTDDSEAPAAIPDISDDAKLGTEQICTHTEDTDSPRHFST